MCMLHCQTGSCTPELLSRCERFRTDATKARCRRFIEKAGLTMLPADPPRLHSDYTNI